MPRPRSVKRKYLTSNTDLLAHLTISVVWLIGVFIAFKLWS